MTDPALDKLLQKVCHLGRYHAYSFFLICIAISMSGMCMNSIVFIGKNLPHRCLVKECENVSSASYQSTFNNFTIPLNEKYDWDSCTSYSFVPSDHVNNRTVKNEYFELCEAKNYDNSSKEKCQQWVYDTSEFQSTVVTEFDIVCSKSWLQPMSQSLYMTGAFTGCLFFGALSDKYGRRAGIMGSLLTIVVGGFTSAFSTNYYIFLLSRFIIGNTCTFMIGFVLAVEMVSPDWRNFNGIMSNIPYALGSATVGVLAYFIRDWKWLQIACTVPSLFLLISYWWLLPESVRWLATIGKLDNAKKEIKKIARWNKITLLPEEINSIRLMYEESKVQKTAGDPVDSKDIKTENAWDILKYTRMKIRTVILCLGWFTCNICYYGLGLNSVNLGGNVFVNYIAVMLVEIPSYIITFFLLDRIGRKASLVFGFMLAGLSCGVSGLLLIYNEELMTYIVIFSTLGKFGISATFAIIYVMAAEIYPTPFRSFAIGVCATFGTIGSIIAPFIGYLGTFFQSLPFLIFGLLALSSGFLTLLLPEPLGIELSNTWKMSENMGSDQGLFYFACCKRSKKVHITKDATEKVLDT